VDRYVAEDGKTYVRVVDYKTGSRTFSLEEVANGLDLQMLLYLFALWGKPLGPDGEEAHPASVLYLNGMEKMSSCSTREEMEKVKEDTRFGLSREGLFLSLPELLSAQDPKGEGEFIPVAWNTGKTKGKENLVTLEELGRLRAKVEKDFIRFAAGMKEGKIGANPLYSEKKNLDPCQYCQHILMCKRSPECRRDYRSGITKATFLSEEEEAE
jgi:ATP-dependent helicase/nuclease subunit B